MCSKNKFLLVVGLIGFFAFTSCDKVENPIPANGALPGDPWELYPDGDSAHYVANAWPSFTENTNVNRNLLIEDFTGHKCSYCPVAGAEAESLSQSNPGRVIVEAIHTCELGMSNLQAAGAEPFGHDFTCPEGLAIGQHLGSDWPSSPFMGNPYGTVSRTTLASGYPVEHPSTWNSTVTTLLAANDLKVNLQTATNYYPSTRGLFVHVEADVLDTLIGNELNLVVQVVEDSIVKPQQYPGGSGFDQDIDPNYVHRDVLRGSVNYSTFGETLDVEHLDANGKYYYFYKYKLPSQFNPSNMHLVIYVRDTVTEEIYQVIEKHFY